MQTVLVCGMSMSLLAECMAYVLKTVLSSDAVLISLKEGQGAKERNHPGSVLLRSWALSRSVPGLPAPWLQLQVHSGSISSHKFSGALVEQGPADKQGLRFRLRPTFQPVLREPAFQ